MKPDYFKKSIRFWFVTILILSFSCNKILDYYPGHSHVKSKCRILGFEVSEIPGYTTTFTIAYNSIGNPINMLNSNKGTGYPDLLFRYDKKGRLTDMIQLLREDHLLQNAWIKYQYNSKNQIITDSTWGPALFNSNSPYTETSIPVISSYEYDELGRLSKRTIHDFFSEDENPDIVIDYNYDERGNLIRGGTYDNKKNLNLTHPLWRFLTGDYSLNNLDVATGYNQYDFPTGFGEGGGAVGFALYALFNSKIYYDCKK